MRHMVTSDALPGERPVLGQDSWYAIRLDSVIILSLTWGKAELSSLDSHPTLISESLE